MRYSKKLFTLLLTGALVFEPTINLTSTVVKADLQPVRQTITADLNNDQAVNSSTTKTSVPTSTKKKVVKKKAKKKVPTKLSKKQKNKIRRLIKKHKFTGNATIYLNGRRVYTYRNANRAGSAYLINSVQKSLTAGMVMKQISHKKLKLSDKLSKFYRRIPGAKRITIRQLLTMRSGLTQRGPVYQNVNSLAGTLHFSKKKQGKWHYQDVNYILLSHILEKVTKKKYETLFNRMYTRPLKLKHTHFVWHSRRGIAPAMWRINVAQARATLGAGSVAMANSDLYKAEKSLLNGKVLTKHERDTIFGLAKKYKVKYSGFYSRKANYASNGADYGYRTFLRLSKDGKIGVIFQSNKGSKHGFSRVQIDKVYKIATSRK